MHPSKLHRLAALGLAAAAAGVAAWVYLRKSINGTQELPLEGLAEQSEEAVQPKEAENQQQRKLHLPTPAASEYEALGENAADAIAQNIGALENSVFNAEGGLEQQNSVFESVPEGAAAADEDDELPAPRANLALSLERIVNVMHEHVECNPAVLHLACVGYEFEGPHEESEPAFNPAVCSPVMLGHWCVRKKKKRTPPLLGIRMKK
jgi:hypothetical protein